MSDRSAPATRPREDDRDAIDENPSSLPVEGDPALGISMTQVAGSALAAVSAAVATSFFGTAGTLIGAALVSIVATVGSAAYTRSLERGAAAVRRGAQSLPATTGRIPALRSTAVLADSPEPGPHVEDANPGKGRPPWRQTLRQLPWPRVAAGAAVVTVLALGTITLVETVQGESLSSRVTGADTSGSTTWGELSGSSSDGSGSGLGRFFDSGDPSGRDGSSGGTGGGSTSDDGSGAGTDSSSESTETTAPEDETTDDGTDDAEPVTPDSSGGGTADDGTSGTDGSGTGSSGSSGTSGSGSTSSGSTSGG